MSWLARHHRRRWWRCLSTVVTRYQVQIDKVCVSSYTERERERQIQSIKDIELQPAAAVHAVKTPEKTCSNSKQVQVRWHLRGDDWISFSSSYFHCTRDSCVQCRRERERIWEGSRKHTRKRQCNSTGASQFSSSFTSDEVFFSLVANDWSCVLRGVVESLARLDLTLKLLAREEALMR